MIWGYAIAMMMMALIIILLPLWRRPMEQVTLDSNTANVAVLKEQLQELEADFSNGNMSEEQYDRARIDLEAAVAVDLDDACAQPAQTVSLNTRRLLSLILLISVPLGSVVMYQQISTFEAVPEQPAVAANGNGAAAQQHSINEMIESLAARLRENPDDAEGWIMLGKSYAVMNQVTNAIGAYGQAYRLIGDTNPNMLIDYAEVLSIANGNRVEGRAAEMANLVLRQQPNNPKANWLAGFADFQQNNFRAAIEKWQRVLQTPGLSNPARQTLNKQINEAQKMGGLPMISQPPVDGVASASSVQVKVSLDEKLVSKVSASDTVFVFAKAVTGMPAPLAVKKLVVSDLPIVVTLDDSMAMMPGHSLSSKDNVIIGARISKQGTPTPVAGDIQGLTGNINPKVTTEASVLIDQIIE
jgi:cytochrome c-type biogenesis protein CcmH